MVFSSASGALHRAHVVGSSTLRSTSTVRSRCRCWASLRLRRRCVSLALTSLTSTRSRFRVARVSGSGSSSSTVASFASKHAFSVGRAATAAFISASSPDSCAAAQREYRVSKSARSASLRLGAILHTTSVSSPTKGTDSSSARRVAAMRRTVSKQCVRHRWEPVRTYWA